MKIKKLSEELSELKNITAEITILAGISDNKHDKEKLHKMSVDLLMRLTSLEQQMMSEGGISKTVKSSSVKYSGDKAEKKKKAAGRGKGKSAKSLNFDETNPEVIQKEVQKVYRRLPNWAQNQQQFNSRILTTYLKLRKASGEDYVMEKDLAEKFEDIKKFRLNYNTMKAISLNNNGKVFAVKDKMIRIWPPVNESVMEYENIVLG